MLHRLIPEEDEVAGLLALMLLTDARRDARTNADGSLVPLADQQRGLWNRNQLEEGVALVTRILGNAPVGPYQLQAAIAAVHDEAPSDAATDWPPGLALLGALDSDDHLAHTHRLEAVRGHLLEPSRATLSDPAGRAAGLAFSRRQRHLEDDLRTRDRCPIGPGRAYP